MSGAAFARMARYARRLRPRRRPAARVRERRRQGARRVERPRPPRPPAAVGPGLLRARRRGSGRGLPARLLRLHRPVRRQDRRRQPHLAARHPRLRARLRGGRLRRARAPADGRRPRPARPAGRGPRVRTTVLGAGPAGLYLAILLKKADPRHEVVVVERNPPDATFGFGVVFSEETLGAPARRRRADLHRDHRRVRQLDRRSTCTIGGEVIRSRGHRFSAIRRTKLLDILQRRARELGRRAALRARGAATSASCRTPTCVVGADGVNSLVRRTHEAAFAPTRRRLPDALRLVRHRPRARRVHVRVRRDRARRLPGPRLSVRRAHEHVHRRDAGGHVAARRARRARRAGEPRVLPRAVRRRARRPPSCCPTARVWLAFNELALQRTGAPARRCCSATPRTPRTSRSARAPSSRWRTRSSSPRRSGATDDLADALVDYELERRPVVERFQEAARESAEYFEERPAPLGAAAAAVRVQPAHPQRAHRPRQPHAARPAARPAGGRVPRRPRARSRRRRCSRRCELRGAHAAPTGAVVAGLDARRRGARTVAGPWRSRPMGASRPDDPVDPAGWREDVDAIHAAGAAAMLALNHAGRRGACRPRAEGVDLPLRDGRLAAGRRPRRSPTRRRSAGARRARRGGHGADPRRVRRSGAARRRGRVRRGRAQPRPGLPARLVPLAARRTAATDAYGGDRAALPALGRRRPCAPRATAPLAGAVGGSGRRRASPPRCARPAPISSTSPPARPRRAPPRSTVGGISPRFSDRIRSEAHVATLVGGYLDTLDAANTIVGAGRADLCLLEPAAFA